MASGVLLIDFCTHGLCSSIRVARAPPLQAQSAEEGANGHDLKKGHTMKSLTILATLVALLLSAMPMGSIASAAAAPISPTQAPHTERHCTVNAVPVGSTEMPKLRCFSSKREAGISIQKHNTLAVFYEHANESGSTLTVFNNDNNSTACSGGLPDLRQVGFNDKISSLNSRCNYLELYFDTWYGAPLEPFGLGFSNVSPGMNDEASSIKFFR